MARSRNGTPTAGHRRARASFHDLITGDRIAPALELVAFADAGSGAPIATVPERHLDLPNDAHEKARWINDRLEAFADNGLVGSEAFDIEVFGGHHRQQPAPADRLDRLEGGKSRVVRPWHRDRLRGADAARIAGGHEAIGIDQRHLAVGVDVEDQQPTGDLAYGFEDHLLPQADAIATADADLQPAFAGAKQGLELLHALLQQHRAQLRGGGCRPRRGGAGQGPRMPLNPIGIVRDARIDTISLAFRAALTPTDDANLPGAAVGVVHDQRPTAVALAAVLATVLEAGTNLPAADGGVGVAAFALLRPDALNRGFQQHRRTGKELAATVGAGEPLQRLRLGKTETSNANLGARCRIGIGAGGQRQTADLATPGPAEFDQRNVFALARSNALERPHLLALRQPEGGIDRGAIALVHHHFCHRIDVLGIGGCKIAHTQYDLEAALVFLAPRIAQVARQLHHVVGQAMRCR